MARRYEKKTARRSREERQLSLRAEHKDTPDLHKLTELLIRFALQETGEQRAARTADGRSVAGVSASS